MSSTPLYTFASCYGYSESHIAHSVDGSLLHADVIAPWQQLTEAANKAGFDLKTVSAYRSFNRQSMIWNAKLRGERPVLDDQSRPLDISTLPPLDRIKRVMRWSALPGASRHHWGSDMDIYDAAAVPHNYSLQLTADEYVDGGPFAPLIQWLKQYLEQHHDLGFYFPYQIDHGGVMPELWHLSFRPVAERFQSQWSLKGLSKYLVNSTIEEKQTVLDHVDVLYKPFIVSSINPQDLVV